MGYGKDDKDAAYRVLKLTNQWNMLDYTILHLWHERFERSSHNNNCWFEFTVNHPGLVSEMLVEADTGNVEHPTLIKYTPYPDGKEWKPY